MENLIITNWILRISLVNGHPKMPWLEVFLAYLSSTTIS
jgi:hypothetical protein